MLKEELQKDSTKIYLQVENPEDNGQQIDIVNVVTDMKKKKRRYGYLLVFAVCIGVCLGLLVAGVQYLMGKSSYARAVISFQYEGIEDGLDPNGAAFDVNKLKAPVVIEDALRTLGITDISVEDIRKNIVIEGVIPEDAVERITVIKEMALEDASNYEKILDVSYFPSQYIIYLYKDSFMSGTDTTAILDAVLESYRTYFMDTYANTEVLTVTSNLIDYKEYDYAESINMLESQIEIMLDYVTERKEQAADFRSVNTGLSFGDIETSLRTVEEIDLSNLISYVENATLSKDKVRMQEYYEYRIRKYNMELSELQVQLTTVQNTIDTYVKDPVVIVSSQESTQELTQTNEYYDKLIDEKLRLNRQIAATNTELNEVYEQLNRMNSSTKKNSQEEYDYADAMLEKVASTLEKWVTLTEETTEEYYATTLFSNAYKIAVPAKYQPDGGIVQMAKYVIVCVAVMVFLVLVMWCLDGLKIELMAIREKQSERYTKERR